MRRLVLLAIGAALLISPSAGAAPAGQDAQRSEILRASIKKSIGLLDRAQFKFERQATCSSCHNQVDPMVAASALRGHGVMLNPVVYDHQLAATVEVLKLRHNYMLGHEVGGGAEVVVAAMLAGLAEVGYGADQQTDDAVVYLLAKQGQKGAWNAVAVRTPNGESAFDVTARAVRAVDAYAPPSLRKEADEAIGRARTWLLATPAGPDSLSRAFRLQGLVWAKAPRGSIAAAARDVASAQNQDGGWSQKPGLASDAFSTGEGLIALHRSGVKTSDPVYRRGLDYLLRTQASDGSWHVTAHALPIQPPIDSGFPYGRDQWISSWATAYAVTAMGYAL
ncbi:prenyltransferase/squalene oxidase repeat-containing protein [Phenylobacterium sp.]|jgi:N-acyl-D-amino-acid deacylase|uniref:prenyltransferase/squalene oxidase repeat-containing protein n=1 Tax=Phenylobacterium sp. TaxID=1871053 RepID=UPI002F40C6F0